MKEKIRNFLSGRNGVDSLSSALLWGSLFVMLLGGFISIPWLKALVCCLALAGVIYSDYRVFSRDISRRQAENWRFVSWKNQGKLCWQQRKTHRFYRCPKCKTMLRLPRGKGKINITCRNCGEKFIRKT